ncbi:Xaa-Pro dipeptidase [Paucibacter sp. KCTC 42545]|uniref:Xaa-Pro dipeptidase n=1 Tax=Paucibacter sp. KCTC 42545 TaxID=1768242 RepID=UPI000733C453|nr:Xaa-Pro dipeptidase [Paucibacter sp. KCTC 42545]ALT75903.1 Xaa-Pro dipeptidase [Paucibacter sp. KCTC 42545]
MTKTYSHHLHQLQAQAEQALARCGFDALVIASGIEKYAFLDDRPYLFAPNPHFKHWLPLVNHPHSWLLIRPGHKPRVVYYQPDDFWHVPPSDPAGEWTELVELVVIGQPDEARAHLQVPGRLAIIGEADAALDGVTPNNPADLLNILHYQRANKTGYELEQMRAASRRAVPAHLAAKAAFLAGASELDIHRAYLAACGHTDRDLPYTNIVALNEHGAVLHYQYQEAQAPAESRALLIDAGAQVNGYASDITRTWSAGDAMFDALLARMEAAQLALVDEVRAGVDYRSIHLSTHAKVAGILQDLGVVKLSVAEQLAQGVTSTFFPHGIGHLIGLQVHDVGGFMADDSGTLSPKPEGHPYLRLTRTLTPGMVVTIEPGLYFIPTLLNKLKATPAAAAVDWNLVAHLSRFGGVRIEDDVVCRADGAPENLTRDAFAAQA